MVSSGQGAFSRASQVRFDLSRPGTERSNRGTDPDYQRKRMRDRVVRFLGRLITGSGKHRELPALLLVAAHAFRAEIAVLRVAFLFCFRTPRGALPGPCAWLPRSPGVRRGAPPRLLGVRRLWPDGLSRGRNGFPRASYSRNFPGRSVSDWRSNKPPRPAPGSGPKSASWKTPLEVIR